MENLNESLKEAVCIDEEVFFGPIADKEIKIREHFENVFLAENKTIEPHVAVENDISKNDSLYKSFSVDESKYDSFEDSLIEDDKMSQEAKHITFRKSFDKLKPKRHAFYDSLEDVCSLVSKCSISQEVDNNLNFNDKQNVIEDSLKNPPVVVTNKSNGISEQIHFDDDSLAILELENTFDDSLEEINDVCVEIEEIDDVENMTSENQDIGIKIEQNPVNFPRNLFDTSVQIVYEKKWLSDTGDQEELSVDKNMLHDSLSNSDFKDVLKDSLEESEKSNENLNLLKHISDAADASLQKSEGMFAGQNSLDASVQILYEDFRHACHIENTSEISNSENNEFSKDSLENCKNINKDNIGQLNNRAANEDNSHSFNTNAVLLNENTIVSQKISENLSADTSDNVLGSDSNANQDDKILKSNSITNDNMLPESNVDNSTQKEIITVDSCYLKFLNDNLNIDKDLKFKLQIQVTVGDKKCQISSKEIKVLSSSDVDSAKCENESLTSVSIEYPSGNLANENNDDKSNSKVNSNTEICNIVKGNYANEENDKSKSKVNSNTEISNVDRKNHPDEANDGKSNSKVNCNAEIHNKVRKNFANEENYVLDKSNSKVISNTEISNANMKNHADEENKNESNSKVNSNAEIHNELGKNSANEENDVLDKTSKVISNIEVCNAVKENFVQEEAISDKHFCEKSKNTTNITYRPKSSGIQLASENSVEKCNFPENLSNISLLQALDLHDISASFLNESVIQSNDSLMPLNLCCKDLDVYAPIFIDESKENVPQPLLTKKKSFCTSSRKTSPDKVYINKTPKHLQKSPCLKDSTKKASGTKIPVRKIENFAVPIGSSNKPGKQIPMVQSAEKAKKCQHSPHSSSKKTPVTTPNKTPHFCKVRNTIFSKVPQIVPSKKYINIQSPVAQYIKNIHGSGKTHFDPVLRDCMNQPVDFPYHSHQTPKSGTLKSTKKKI